MVQRAGNQLAEQKVPGGREVLKNFFLLGAQPCSGAWTGLAVKGKQQLMNKPVNEGLIRRGKCVTV